MQWVARTFKSSGGSTAKKETRRSVSSGSNADIAIGFKSVGIGFNNPF